MQITALECKLRHWNAYYDMGMQITAWECKITAWECKLRHGNANYDIGMQITTWECRLRHWNADYDIGMQITAWECKLRHGNANYGMGMQITTLECRLRHWNANYGIGMQITTLECKITAWECKITALECRLQHGNANYDIGMQNYGMGMQNYGMGMQITTWECRLQHGNANYGMGMQITAWECRLQHGNANYGMGMQITAWECNNARSQQIREGKQHCKELQWTSATRQETQNNQSQPPTICRILRHSATKQGGWAYCMAAKETTWGLKTGSVWTTTHQSDTHLHLFESTFVFVAPRETLRRVLLFQRFFHLARRKKQVDVRQVLATMTKATTMDVARCNPQICYNTHDWRSVTCLWHACHFNLTDA